MSNEEFLNKLVTNDVSGLKNGQAQYTVMCTHEGGIVDDLIIYKRDEGKYLLCVNAGNIEKDFEWCQKIRKELNLELTLENHSEKYGEHSR